MNILFNHDAEVAAFVGQLLGEGDFGPCTTMGFLDAEGRLVAGVVYHNFHRRSGAVELTAASAGRRWGTRDRGAVLRVIFDYPFGFARIVVGRTSECNPAALRIWRRIGASEHRIPELRGPGEAEIITTLTKEQWHGWQQQDA